MTTLQRGTAMTTTASACRTTAKLTLAEILEIFAAGDELPLKFTAYDGSSAGPDDADARARPADAARHHLPRHRARRSGAGPRLRRRATWSRTACIPAIPTTARARWPTSWTSSARRRGCWPTSSAPSASSTSSRSPRRRRRRCRAGGASRKACGTARLVTPRPSTTTTTCRTRSTSGCSGRR